MKTKVLISFAITAKLICVFVFAYADCWFVYDVAYFMNCSENISKAILPVLLIQDEHYCQLVVKGMCTRDWYPASRLA